MEMTDEDWMRRALQLAERAAEKEEVPIGAVLVQDNQCIGEGHNVSITHHDPTAHAEIIALRQAAQALGNYRLPNTRLYVTLEPCAMCAGALITARVKRVVFGAYDPRAGAAGSVLNVFTPGLLNHTITYQGGVLAEPCAELLKQFFQARRR